MALPTGTGEQEKYKVVNNYGRNNSSNSIVASEGVSYLWNGKFTIKQ